MSNQAIDWEERTTGSAPYVADERLPNTLVGRILRSPHPYARILSVDVTEAERAEGVAAVLTAADFPDDPTYVHHGGAFSDRRPLARDVVRFVGEEVVAVAAETAEQAENALERIRVKYRPLRAATTMSEALRSRAPRVHDRRSGSNIGYQVRREYGNVAQARANTQFSVAGNYRFGRQAHACMETNGTLASWDPDQESLQLWVSTQSPYFVRKEVAHVLGLDVSQVIIREVTVGGGFGSKSKIGEHEVLAAALSIKTGRPVRLILSREEEFATTKSRHNFEIRLESGAEASGRLTYRRADILVDNGAYNHTGPSVMLSGIGRFASLYRTQAVQISADLVDTNKQPGGQFRGYGGPQATFAIESQIDELADAIGMDPIDLRIINTNRTGDVTHVGWKITSSRLTECLEAVRHAIDWDEKRRSLGGAGRGVGVAVAIHPSGAYSYDGANRSQATIDIGWDGEVVVRFGGADPGTGQKTLLAQIAARELGVDPSEVSVVMMDTEETPIDLGAWSSRGTVMGGHAVMNAARSAAQALRARAAEKLGVDADSVSLSGGEASDGESTVPIGELATLLSNGGDRFRTNGSFVADIAKSNFDSGIGNVSAAYSFAAHAAEVEVDQDTGEVRVLAYVAAHDCGVALNQIAVESQIIGGVVMGLGAALGEELIYEGGRLVNPAYIHYAMPRAGDVPPIRPIIIGDPDPGGPYGAKGVGEISLEPVPAAIANAVSHAVGFRIRELPITPDRVIRRRPRTTKSAIRRYRLWRRPSRWWVTGVRFAYPRGLHATLHRWGTRFAKRIERGKVAIIERPSTIVQAVRYLAADRGAVPIGGGTDLLPARRQGLVQATRLVDLTAVPDLKGIREDAEGGLWIGGGVTLGDLERYGEKSHDGILRDVASTIASVQIREMATVGGNLCQEKRCWFYRNDFKCYKRGGATCPCYAVLGDNRFYHAALGAHRCQAVTPSDLATVFAALDAEVHLAGSAGRRVLPITDFFVGPGETALKDDEIVVGVRLRRSARERVTSFQKLRLWEGDFAVVSVCTSLRVGDDGTVSESRVVIGAIAPTPYRARATEKALANQQLVRNVIGSAANAWIREAHPLPGNDWKVDAASGLVRRCLNQSRPSCVRGRGIR